jgi:hypothetical protein
VGSLLVPAHFLGFDSIRLSCSLIIMRFLLSILDANMPSGEQRRRHGDAKQPSGLKVDDELELVGRNTGRLAGFAPPRIRPTYIPT